MEPIDSQNASPLFENYNLNLIWNNALQTSSSLVVQTVAGAVVDGGYSQQLVQDIPMSAGLAIPNNVIGNGGGIPSLTTGLIISDEGTLLTSATTSIDFVGANLKVTASNTEVTVSSGIVTSLTDGATPALNAASGDIFLLTALGNRTIAVPTNPTSGQKIIIAHLASGGARTLSLNSGAGGFRFGTTITALTATASGKTDYIGCIYNLADNKFDVVAMVKGY